MKTIMNAKPKKELPKDHPMRLSFEAKIRKLNPKMLFIERWPKVDVFGKSTGDYAGKYTHIETQSMWEGYQLGYKDGQAQAHEQRNKKPEEIEGF